MTDKKHDRIHITKGEFVVPLSEPVTEVNPDMEQAVNDLYDYDFQAKWNMPEDEACIDYVNRDRVPSFIYYLFTVLIVTVGVMVYNGCTYVSYYDATEPATEADFVPLSLEKSGYISQTKFWIPPMKHYGKRLRDTIDMEARPSGWSPVSDPVNMRISCYDRTGNVTASGLSIDVALELAESLGCGGICAVSPDTRYYAGRKDTPYQTVYVEGHGVYMVVDCTAPRIENTIDIFVDGCNSNAGLRFLDYENVWEVSR